ncbi:hypothetical protein M5X06_00185 [Paenibacillus alvei]|uniref:Uncharacterized protein n=1 Tax=Paenibacillus alvei TaxID=44250 RepID=A0ABT4GVC7_PAEAL|nr:hypothetical protein [Paenibacillus alvei]MCY9760639.1 hypothetical protein [Paenibacillus alvei]MCY9765253.1 hypothetical protein [Paenibacillus alvei]NEZ44364.1 hypothetical protein [Paenibacillus alvei]
MKEIEKAYTELIKLYPGLEISGGWVDSYGNIRIIRNMEAQHIHNVIKELNKQFKGYCTRNDDGEFVGICAETINKKLDELQEALQNTNKWGTVEYFKDHFNRSENIMSKEAAFTQLAVGIIKSSQVSQDDEIEDGSAIVQYFSNLLKAHEETK